MAEGWKQVWEDFLNALKGEAKPAEPATSAEAPPAEPPPPPAAGEAASPVPAEGATSPVSGSARVGTASSGETVADASAALASATPQAVAHTALSAAPAETQPAPATPSAEPDDSIPPTPRQIWFERLRVGSTYLALAIALIMVVWPLGLGESWAQWTAPKPPASDVVATYDGGEITTAELEEHFELLVPEEYRAQVRSLETLRFVVQEMVADELARRWAAEQKIDDDETFRDTMQHVTEDINIASFSEQLHSSGLLVQESEIQAYYDANRAQFGDQPLSAVRDQIAELLTHAKQNDYLRDYIDRLKENASITRNFELLDVPPPSEADLQTYSDDNRQDYTAPARFTVDMLAFRVDADEAAARAAADKALLKLRSGADFAAIPADVPEAQVITNTTVNGDALGAEWMAAMTTLQPGGLSEVFRSGNMLYIVRLLETQPARELAFDEVRSQVLNDVWRQQTEGWINANASKTLFTIKSKQYTLGQFYREYNELPLQIQAQFAGLAGLKNLAEQLIDRLVLVEDTYDQLLQVKNKELIDQTRLDVLKQMMHQQEVDDKVEVAEEEIKQYYEQNQSLMALPPQVRIRYIRIALGQTEDEKTAAHTRAEEAYKKLNPGLLQQGADFASVAKEFSEDPETAANGGELPGWIGQTLNLFEPPELQAMHAIALQLIFDEISQPFQVGDSLYIIQVIDRTQPRAISFDEARPYIEALLTQRKHDNLLLQLQERLAKQVDLVIYDSVLQEYYDKTAAVDNP